MRSALALAFLPALAAATISINGPSSSAYWVQNTSNTISWSFAQGDPNPVSMVITNAENTTLNGAFYIAEFVNVSQESFTVTNVTLLPASNYQVVFVNPLNASQVYANSSDFDVRDPGTPPAQTPGSSSTSGSASSSSSPSSSASTGSSAGSSTGRATGSSSGSSPSSSSTAPASSGTNGAAAAFGDVTGILYTLGACGLASLTALLL
ncbi:hypothetical protein FA95DRAFT_1554609 [Auriscalpium vulgare]|uniref:Uncharacterized protein n=1 Tax=Auriscalpium vulgare TaxID=40419 RepID=A0ACB8S451_9AGAM|nr:hypothetical protein FA95DRAFT_1554609 [Auriscalpium vulgare]